VVKVRAGVEAPMEEQPSEKLDLIGELHLPDVHEVGGGGGDRVQCLIGPAGGEGGICSVIVAVWKMVIDLLN